MGHRSRAIRRVPCDTSVAAVASRSCSRAHEPHARAGRWRVVIVDTVGAAPLPVLSAAVAALGDAHADGDARVERRAMREDAVGSRPRHEALRGVDPPTSRTPVMPRSGAAIIPRARDGRARCVPRTSSKATALVIALAPAARSEVARSAIISVAGAPAAERIARGARQRRAIRARRRSRQRTRALAELGARADGDDRVPARRAPHPPTDAAASFVQTRALTMASASGVSGLRTSDLRHDRRCIDAGARESAA